MTLPGRSIQEAVIVVIFGFLIGIIFSAIVYLYYAVTPLHFFSIARKRRRRGQTTGLLMSESRRRFAAGILVGTMRECPRKRNRFSNLVQSATLNSRSLD